MFLPVNFIGRRRAFPREALTHLLVKAAEVGRREPARVPALRAHLSPLGLDRILDSTGEDSLATALSLIGAHRYASGPEFEALIGVLSAELGLSDVELSELDSFVDWDKVEVLGRAGFTFGGHGADHRVLTQVAPAVVQAEIESSKRVLDARLARPVYAFAYPNGGWNADIARTVQAGGYRLAFTIDQGHVACDDNPLTLRRINIHEGMTRSTPMFMARLAGIF
jgi:peptidoglycan/xylan/chitin deacetylase (PgdA/CDA1 family)